MAEDELVTIEKLGAQGDGLVATASGHRFISGALPGERWHIAADGASELVEASAERAAPVCRHYGTCGGCMAQHMPDALYSDWKRSIVADAFAHRGLAADVQPVVRMPLRSRRRAFLGVEWHGSRVTIGFREEGRHDLVDMLECPVLEPEIVAALPVLRDMTRIAMPETKSGRLIVTHVAAGLDVSFDNGVKMLESDARAKLAKLAAAARIARLTVAGDPVVMRAEPQIIVSGVAIDTPQGIFLQAVEAAERAMIDMILAAVPKKARAAADLFSGIGTFTFPLAARLKVSAFDSDKRAIAVLQAAAKRATGLKPIEAKVRDLFREPLSPRELDGFDIVVFDPPRAGANEQAERLGRSKVPVVVAISCAPSTLARDAKTLIEAGFKMSPVTPIDQFIFSPHIEAVTVFTR